MAIHLQKYHKNKGLMGGIKRILADLQETTVQCPYVTMCVLHCVLKNAHLFHMTVVSINVDHFYNIWHTVY